VTCITVDLDDVKWFGTMNGISRFDDTTRKPSHAAVNTPAVLAITGNHPNPFNPSTSIEFTLPRAGSVRLGIFNQSGQLVRELVNGGMTAGTHTEMWNGKDSRGRLVSSGIYIARLAMDGGTVTRKLTLMK